MPTKFSEDFRERATTVERRRANLNSTINFHLQAAIGTPEDVIGAYDTRVAFIRENGNPDAADRVASKTPSDPARIRNLYTLQQEMGEEHNYAARLQEIMDHLDADFPELDEMDILFLKQDLTQLFTTSKQGRFCASDDHLDTFIVRHFGSVFDRELSSTFAKCGRDADSYRAVVNVDPGTAYATSEFGDNSEHAAALKEQIAELHRDVSNAAEDYYEQQQEKRRAARKTAASHSV